MSAPVPADRIDAAMSGFMRYFLVYVNPVLHRTEYRGRSFSELEIIACMALSVLGPMRPSGLSRGLRIEKGTLTSVIRRLRELGLVERTEVVGDERGYRVSLTAAGHQLIEHLTEQRRRGFRELFATMDPETAEAAARGVELLTTHLRDREERNGQVG
ncbi:MAG: winged helix DNA-binding protein [Propionibacteriaceae bacterium]|nr:winged helix DNA-binding protein [Propionibacteriaceae bacterium]